MDLGHVDHDHVIAGVLMGSEDGLVLAPQHPGHLGRQPPEDGTVGVDLVPDALDVGGFRGVGTHVDDLG